MPQPVAAWLLVLALVAPGELCALASTDPAPAHAAAAAPCHGMPGTPAETPPEPAPEMPCGEGCAACAGGWLVDSSGSDRPAGALPLGIGGASGFAALPRGVAERPATRVADRSPPGRHAPERNILRL